MGLLDRFRLDDKVAVVTGAGRGIGASTARAFAEAGADLVLTARTKEQLEEVAADVEKHGRRAVVLPGDVNELDHLTLVVDTAVAELGGIDVVVNNAGGSMPMPFLDTSPGSMERAFHFNVVTAFELTRKATPHLLERQGSVVNISSVMSKLADRGYAAYGTAKAALNHLTELLAFDLAPKVRVNAIAVGSTATAALEIVLQSDELREEMIDKTPLKRLGEPEDIALCALYLASPAAAFVTGQVWDVSGGIRFPNLGLNLPDL